MNSILRAAAETKRPILLKEGQFMSPWNMKTLVRKLNRLEVIKLFLLTEEHFLDIT